MTEASAAGPAAAGPGARPGDRRAGPTAGRRAWHLRTKLVVATLVLLTLICAAIGVVSHVAMNAYLTSELDGGLAAAAERVVRPPGGGPRRPSAPDPSEARGQRPGTLNALFDDGAARVSAVVQDDGSTKPLTASDLMVVSRLTPGSTPVETVLSSGRYRVVSAVVPDTGDVLVTGLSTADRDRTLASLDGTIAAVSLVGVLLTGLAGTLIIRRSLRPLEELSAVATSVTELPLASGEVAVNVRVPPTAAQPGTEVGTVGIALNEMIDHVTRALKARQDSETRVRSFVADASHELRTPLTSIRGYTELVLMGDRLQDADKTALKRVASESERMSSLVEDLLLLARLDEGQRGEPTDVDLTELAVEVTSDVQLSAPDHVWTLDLPEEPVHITAVESEIRQVLINLIANAHKHTPPGTTILTAVRTAGPVVTVTVSDNGPGIDDAFLGSIFTRFSRADAARSGTGSTGLGLAIVQALVHANGGTISVTSQPGNTRFTVTLPV